jgi:hypothetical protein
VSAKIFDLPPLLREAVTVARAKMVNRETAPFVLPDVAPEVTAWAKHLVASGDLRRAIEDIASQDPDLAS